MAYDYTRYYRHFHDGTEKSLELTGKHYYLRLLPYLPSRPTGEALDIGCGAGFAVWGLRNAGWNVQGIDQDPGQIETALKFGLRVSHVEDSIGFLKEHKNCYSLIVILDVIEHLEVPKQVELVKAIHDALVPGGRMICTVPNANSGVAMRWRYGDYTHYSSFTEHSIDFLLFHGGFSRIRVFEDNPRVWGFWPPWIPRWRLRWYYVRCCFHFLRRLELASELGWEVASKAPFSPNLLAVADRCDQK